jgi:hypothetical protein
MSQDVKRGPEIAGQLGPLWIMLRKTMTNLVVAAGLCMLVAASAQARHAAVDRPMVLAQGGFTFGPRDDLGPRYDPYSERWDKYKPSDSVVCRWLAVRTPLADGKVPLRRQRVCGFKVPARQ